MTRPSSFLRFSCFLGLCAFLFMQSLGSQTVKSGKSENANAKPIGHFTDMAQKAGLTAPAIFGGEKTKKDIIETTGRGMALFYYANDGWPDIFVVNGTKLEGWATSQPAKRQLVHYNNTRTCAGVT